MITWTCMVCKEERLDAAISVHKVDRSVEFALPRGSFVINVRYCNDRAECIAGAPAVGQELVRKAKSAEREEGML